MDDVILTGDLDGALRLLEDLLARREWDRVVEFRDGCRAAIERGHQLWPAAEHAEYRLALEAPGRYAAVVVVPGAGRFAPGPLTEVCASTHEWSEVAPYLPPSPAAVLTAHERVVRGEDLTARHPLLEADDHGLPRALFAFEPAYPLAEYRADGVEAQEPPAPPTEWESLHPEPGESVPDPRLAWLRDPLEAWATESEARIKAVASGSPAQALWVLGARDESAVRSLTGSEAMARLAFAGATAGGHGRRRGTAMGRIAAWFAVSGLLGLDWPPTPAALGEGLDQLSFFEWGPPEPGWSFRLAVTSEPVTLAVQAGPT